MTWARTTLQGTFLLGGSLLAAVVRLGWPDLFADRGPLTWLLILGFAVLGAVVFLVGPGQGTPTSSPSPWSGRHWAPHL